MYYNMKQVLFQLLIYPALSAVSEPVFKTCFLIMIAARTDIWYDWFSKWVNRVPLIK